MIGNLYERCQDWYGAYPGGSVIDPQGPDSGLLRVARGGTTLAMKTRGSVLVAMSSVIPMFGVCDSIVGDGKEKGTPESPPDAKAVAGSYYRGDGAGYNVYLTLNLQTNDRKRVTLISGAMTSWCAKRVRRRPAGRSDRRWG